MANTTIKDPSIEPFFITKDQHCYTVVETITPDKKNVGRFKKKDNGNEGKKYEKPIGHYSSFSQALNKIAKEKVDLIEDYSSIKSYLNEWENQQNELKQILNKITI